MSPWIAFLLGGAFTVLVGVLAWLMWRSEATSSDRARAPLGDLDHASTESARWIRWIHGISHELRTPLASIHASLEMLCEAPGDERDRLPDEDRERLLRVAHEESERLARTVAGVLDLARVEVGISELSPRPFEVGDLLEELRNRFHALAEREGVEVTFDPALAASEATLGQAYGDRKRLRQALGQVLDNAIRFTPSGGRVCVRARRDEGLEITIEDQGVGIASEDRERVFDPFYRSDRSRSDGLAGVGLGLAAARRVVRAHGGEIQAVSGEGRGAEFRIRLPGVAGPLPHQPSVLGARVEEGVAR